MDRQEIYDESILLFGPVGVGKTTIANILKKKTYMPTIHFDSLEKEYFTKGKFGYHLGTIKLLSKAGKEEEVFKYTQDCRLKMLSFCLPLINTPSIIDFGGSTSLINNENKYILLLEELKKYKNTIYLIPSPDRKNSIKQLDNNISNDNRRTNKMKPNSLLDKVNLYLLDNNFEEELCNIIVYTENKTPEEIANEILSLIYERNKTL